MRSLDSILKLADAELEAVGKAGKFRSREEIDSVYKLIDIVKDIYCIWDEDGEDEMSYDSRPMRYDGSYARGRNAKRDSMGRYSRRGYSRDDFMDKLRDMADTAPDDQTRQSIQRMLHDME